MTEPLAHGGRPGPWVTIRESRAFLLSCQKCGWIGKASRIEAAMRRAEQHKCPK